jgi:zinc D-Ala-D-Ala carboxypeptidase
MSLRTKNTLSRIKIFHLLKLILVAGLLVSCRPDSTPPSTIAVHLTEQNKPAAKVDKNQSLALELNTPQSATNTPISFTLQAIESTSTAVPSSTPSPTAVSTPTPTPIGSCEIRMPEDDLLAVVTLNYNLSRDYEPEDLVLLTDYLPMSVTLGYPSQIRREALDPLLDMIGDMQAEGLAPRVVSAYRSYAAQAIAWNKWNKLYPEHASIISAPPGHSEHQLGTVVDFGSPELAGIVGQDDIEFHTYFYKTNEGIWLAENAHQYGFTLSYPLEAFELTGFYYEPWHYRYVGVEIATRLKQLGTTLTEYQLANNSQPCIP